MKKVFDYTEILKQVEKPGRYIGGEWNEIKKDPQRIKSKIALVFPDLYEVGMSYLGQKILYFILNNQPSVLAERVFSPWVDLEKELRRKKIPLFSLENKIPLSNFDILGFSLLYELNYSNILTILDLAGIPFFSAERDLDLPIIIAGGPAVFNPEPIADIFDLFLVGDGEEAFLEISNQFINLKQDLNEKSEVLKELAGIQGVYVPSLYRSFRSKKSHLLAVKPEGGFPSKIKKRIVFPFHESVFPEKIIVPNIRTIFDRVSVEVARGCPQKCRFCQASNIYFPSRVKDPNFVKNKVLDSLRSTGYEDASLAALSVSDYPYLGETIESLMEILEKQKISLSLPSLRPKGLTSGIVENIVKVRKTGFTLVPEAGTERLRRVINKNLKNSEIWEASKNAFSKGWRLLKLYFMVGLPTEREEDLEGIVDMVGEIIKIGNSISQRAPQINLSVSSFIPKPHTPFQWLGMEEERVLMEKHKFLKSRLKKYSQVKFKFHPIKNLIIEAVFSRGDRQLTSVLLQAWENGARFDSWSDLFDFPAWEKAFDLEGVDYSLYLSSIDRSTVLPWDHIDAGLKKSHLLMELDKALKEEISASCLDKECKACQECSLWPLYEKNFSGKLHDSPGIYSHFGKDTDNVIRYRVRYSKLGSACFISQIDLNNIIQRGFRRAGVSVDHSKGFHPKMTISYPPALPLGMKGKAEVFEFKSYSAFSSDEFISHMNKFIPSGVKFLRLFRLKSSVPSLSEDIETLIYSVCLEDHELKEQIKRIGIERNIAGADDDKIIEALINDYTTGVEDESLRKLKYDKKSNKLFIHLKSDPRRGPRPQDIVMKIFPIKNPSFFMTREKIVLKDPS